MISDTEAREILDRLIKLEVKLDLVVSQYPKMQKDIEELKVAQGKTESKAASAHHRLDDFETRTDRQKESQNKTIILISTISSTVVAAAVQLIAYGFQHGWITIGGK